MSAASIRRRGRTTTRTVEGQTHRVRVDLTPPAATELATVVIERDDPRVPDERWVWRVTEDRAAEYVTSSVGEESTEVPQVPERIRYLLEELGLVGVICA